MELKSDITFNDLSRIWLYENNLYISWNWQKQQERFVQHLCRFIGEKKVKDIKPIDIDEIIISYSRNNPNTGRPMAKKTMQGLVNTLTRIFDLAIENDIIYKNPATGKKRKIPRKLSTKKVDCISDVARNLILSINHRAKPAAMIMLFAGLRTGETLALTWNDIDFNNKTISVNKSLQRVGSNLYEEKEGTKNGNSRTITMPNCLFEFLLNLKTEIKPLDSDYINAQIDGSLHTPSSWSQVWKSFNTCLNYERYNQLYPDDCKSIFSPDGTPQVLEKVNAHQLRHTYASMLYMSGVDILTAQSLLGHSDVKLTLSIYTHLDEKYKRVSIEKLDNYINNKITTQ